VKTRLTKIIIFSLAVLYFGSCNDPIFFIVHEEPPMLKPLIDGSPTNFAEYDSQLYVATGKKIFSYSNNKWAKWKEIDSFVMCLAATGNYLYALCLNNSNGKIKRYNNDVNFIEDLNLPYNVQSIHKVENVLFICVRNNNTYTIYYLDEDIDISPSSIKEIAGTDSDSMLNGASSDGTYYYLCVNAGIFCVEKSLIDSSSDWTVLEPGANFTGIIKLNDDYSAAISNNGDLYEINNAASTKVAGFNDSRYSTGALALWFLNNSATEPSLLLVGRKEYYYSTTTGYSNGYVEIELDDTGRIKSGAEFREPGKSPPQSIDNYDRYVSSLGKKPVNHIIQTPAYIDGNITLFASTQQDGVWSYRDRNDGNGKIWNAEQ
jgi:hypothetical protein